MNISRFSIKRPIFISCLVILMVITGIIGLGRLGVDLFPPVDFPVVTVTTVYSGATPEEIEKLITKPLEEQVSTIAGIERLSSRNLEGISIVIAEFTYETDIKYAEEKMREKVALARNNLPTDLEDDPLVRQFDFTDQPVLTLAVMADIPPTGLYDMVKEQVKPLIEQVSGVGEVRLSGGTRREIQIELDRNKMNSYEISALTVAEQLKNSGANVPIGKFDRGEKSTIFKTIGEFNTVDQIRKTVVNFAGDVANAVTVEKLGTVRDGAEDVKTLAYIYYPVKDKEKKGFFQRAFGGDDAGSVKKETRPCIILDVYKQSGANSVAVADGVIKRMDRVNEVVKASAGNPRLVYVYDTAKWIRGNIDDVRETMIIGIILAVVVVYFFLGNVRSTIITGIAIPNSILGAFVIMYFLGFTINIMTLMALSLAVGLLVDDAIVVRENIFRKIESGMPALKAAEVGTNEVMLAVVATTLTIIAVFLPIAFLQGIIGRFFYQFGMAVVFAMLISLFDALTVAPLLSAYFAGSGEKAKNVLIRNFDRVQDRVDVLYKSVLTFSTQRPVIVIIAASVVLILSFGAFGAVGKTFQPDADEKELMINFEMPAGTSIQGTYEIAGKIAEKLKKLPELDYMTIQAGNDQGEYNLGVVGVFLTPMSEGRKRHSRVIKEELRSIIREFAFAQPTVDEYDRVGGGGGNKPFILNIKGEDLSLLQDYSLKVIERLNKVNDLTEVTSSYRQGKPEFQVVLDNQRMQMLGVTHRMAGNELRYSVEGDVVGKFREKGLEYDVRMRLKPEQRDIRNAFNQVRVPNIQSRMIPLTAISTGKDTVGPSKIYRQDRARVVQVLANIAPGGAVGTAIEETRKILEKDLPMPKGVSYSFVGQADSFEDMMTNIMIAFFLSLLFIYLVLASLYESFITPVTIFMALPPALSGAFLSLFITGMNMDMFSMIGIIMLLGLVTKNSILLVDFALEGVRAGLDRREAIVRAGMIRLRPILMTTFAMLAGTLPLALGLGEAAEFRQSMGVVIIGGLIISTLITLIVVPAIFEYVDRFREAVESRFRPKTAAAGLPEMDVEEIIRSEFVSENKAGRSKKAKSVLGKRS